jgi:phospholipase/carboxylesterase
LRFQRAKLGVLDCVIARIENVKPRRAVILCHGFGAPGTDLVGLADELAVCDPDLEDVAFIFPAAPIEMEPGFDARAWWPINFAKLEEMAARGEFRDLVESVPPGLAERSGEIERVIVAVRNEFELPQKEIFVGGFSQGAMLTTNVFLEAEESLGGLIAWSGTLLNRSRWKERAEAHRGLRVVQSHGKMDPILPFSGATQLRDLFLTAGHSVDFVPFQGYHAIPGSALAAAARLLAKKATE